MVIKELSDENKEIVSKLHQISSLIFKQYSYLINNEIDGKNDEPTTTNLIDKILILIENENSLLERYINTNNIEELIDAVEDELIYFEGHLSTNSIDDFSALIIKRVFSNLLIKNIALKNMRYEYHNRMVSNLSALYYTKILEEEAKINPNYRKEIIHKKYYLFFLNPVLENLVITNNFIANVDYPNFVNCIKDKDFQKTNRSEFGKEIIKNSINKIEELDDPKDFDAASEGMYLRGCFLLVEDCVANEIVQKYLTESGAKENEYTENQKIVIDAYHESTVDRHKYIQRYVTPDKEVKYPNEEAKILNQFIEKAKNILKLYKKIIEAKCSPRPNEKEIKIYTDLIQTLAENEFQFYQDILSKKETYIKLNIYYELSNKIFGNISTSLIDKFNGFLMSEDIYPEIRVLSLLNSFDANEKSLTERVELVSLIYFMRIIEASALDRASIIYKNHMISYLNPEIENITLCTQFSGANNYPDQVLPEYFEDQSFKNTIALDMSQEIIDQMLKSTIEDNHNLSINCLYLQSILMLANDYIITKLKREMMCLLNDTTQKLLELNKQCNDKINNLVVKDKKIEIYVKRRNIIQYILVAINEAKSHQINLKLIETHEKELNR